MGNSESTGCGCGDNTDHEHEASIIGQSHGMRHGGVTYAANPTHKEEAPVYINTIQEARNPIEGNSEINTKVIVHEKVVHNGTNSNFNDPQSYSHVYNASSSRNNPAPAGAFDH